MTAHAPTILASCAGYAFDASGRPEYGPVMQHMLWLAQVPDGRRPRVLFINTASGDDPGAEQLDLAASERAGVDARHLHLGDSAGDDPAELLRDVDAVWVGGGDLELLLRGWRRHGVDRALRHAWQRGVVLAGTSAGAQCWHRSGTTDRAVGEIEAFHDGLGFIPEPSLAVHYDSSAAWRTAHEAAVRSGEVPAGWALDDGTALLYRGETAVGAFTEHANQYVWAVGRVHGRAFSRPLPSTRLSPERPRLDAARA
jgi:peptidase E